MTSMVHLEALVNVVTGGQLQSTMQHALGSVACTSITTWLIGTTTISEMDFLFGAYEIKLSICLFDLFDISGTIKD